MVRIGVIALMMCVTGLAMVQLRTFRGRCVYRLEQLRRQRERLEHRLWEQQLQLARLLQPERIREKVASFDLAVVPPGEEAALDPVDQ